MNAFLEAALDYAQRGFSVITLPARDKAPPREGWQTLATTHEPTIRQWWRESPQANVGIVTGAKSEIFVFDIDPQHGGEASLQTLLLKHGPLPNTVAVRTGGGGLHLYFRHVAGLGNSIGKIGAGLDIRAEGGYAAAPPSVHPNGTRYEFLPGHPIIAPV